MKVFLSNLLNQNWKSAGQSLLKRFYGSASSVQPRYGSGRLYRKISPVGDPNVSVLPILNQWIEEGNNADKFELQSIIKELTRYRRYSHALQVSQWMTDKRYIPMEPLDVAARINLIHKVHGLEKVEAYFDNIHERFKHRFPYVALLNCYVHEKSLAKAEATMQKLREMGWAKTPLPYNIMMNLYYSMGRLEKLDDLMKEMDEKGLYYDRYTACIRLRAYATVGDSAGIDKIVEMMESNLKIALTWESYVAIVEGYWKVGQVEKAPEMLKKLERLIPSGKDRNSAYTYLLIKYAQLGKREEVYRIWDLFKQKEKKIHNKGYMSMMSSLSKLDDIEGIEKIFIEWESKGLSYDFRLPNLLIGTYCRKGQLGKAEALLERVMAKGGVPSVATWCHLACGYFLDGEAPKALEALNKAVSICPPNFNFVPSKETLITCVEYLQNRGGVEKAEVFIKSLEGIPAFLPAFREKLFCFIKDGKC